MDKNGNRIKTFEEWRAEDFLVNNPLKNVYHQVDATLQFLSLFNIDHPFLLFLLKHFLTVSLELFLRSTLYHVFV